MTNCTCTPISARLIAQCEPCANREFIKALQGLASATDRASQALKGHTR
jgi:hypothetical protein